MHSLLRSVPLIGALFLSASPVQAQSTQVEILQEACEASRENRELCQALGSFYIAWAGSDMLCRLEKKGIIKAEDVTAAWESFRDTHMLYLSVNTQKAGVDMVLEEYPNCKVKPPF